MRASPHSVFFWTKSSIQKCGNSYFCTGLLLFLPPHHTSHHVPPAAYVPPVPVRSDPLSHPTLLAGRFPKHYLLAFENSMCSGITLRTGELMIRLKWRESRKLLSDCCSRSRPHLNNIEPINHFNNAPTKNWFIFSPVLSPKRSWLHSWGCK